MYDKTYDKAERIRDVLRYIKIFKNSVIVIHLDDSVIDSPSFSSHIKDICYIHDSGLNIAIVPGAKKRIDDILSNSDISWQTENSIRITTETAIPLVKMAAFDVANRIMTSLAGQGKTAVIGNWVRARGKGILNGVDYQFTGEIDKLQTESISAILEKGFIPIFPCIGWNTIGKPYNISSITLASEIAIRLRAEKLFYLTNEGTITKNSFTLPSTISLSEENTIPALNLEETEELINKNMSETTNVPNKDQIISLLKLAKHSCQSGVSRVHILDGKLDGTLPCEIFSDIGSGTMIYKNNYGGIRAMNRDDVPLVLNLMRPFVEKEILLPRSEEMLIAQVNDYIVYEMDGGTKACASLHVYENKQAEIAGVAVDQSCAHMGIGPKIITYLINKATKLKQDSVFVLTTQTADWFEQQGFIQDTIDSLPEERKQYWSKKRGSKVLRLKLK